MKMEEKIQPVMLVFEVVVDRNCFILTFVAGPKFLGSVGSVRDPFCQKGNAKHQTCQWNLNRFLGGGFFKYFLNVHPDYWGIAVFIWLSHIFQMGWNQQDLQIEVNRFITTLWCQFLDIKWFGWRNMILKLDYFASSIQLIWPRYDSHEPRRLVEHLWTISVSIPKDAPPTKPSILVFIKIHRSIRKHIFSIFKVEQILWIQFLLPLSSLDRKFLPFSIHCSTKLWWQLKCFFFSPRFLGKNQIWRAYFFRWVVQPPTRKKHKKKTTQENPAVIPAAAFLTDPRFSVHKLSGGLLLAPWIFATTWNVEGFGVGVCGMFFCRFPP